MWNGNSYPCVHRDYETRSVVDLRATGAHTYAAHPETQMMCAVWIIEREFGKYETHSWHRTYLLPIMPTPVRKLIEDGCRVVGHNASFESAMDELHTSPKLGWPIAQTKQLDCTMARAAVQALPLDLDRLCDALNLSYRKDK